MKSKLGEQTALNPSALSSGLEIRDLYAELIPNLGEFWHRHAAVGLKVETLARVLHYNALYQKIVDVPGVICELGVQWGASLVTLTNLRAIYEPYNHGRRVIGFDTFEGFPALDLKDGDSSDVGDYRSMDGHMSVLERLLRGHEASAPLSHIEKFELVKGDISETFSSWLDANPYASISMVVFDTDLYQPTLDVLGLVVPRLTKGSLLVFDEFSCPNFPGETIAVREAIGTHNLKLRRSSLQPFCAWAVWGE